LDPFHLWTPEYAESRLKWRPKKPLAVLVLRTFLLPEPLRFEYRAKYGGCKSWIELEKGVSTAASRPVLDDTAFEELVGPALGVLENLAPVPVGR